MATTFRYPCYRNLLKSLGSFDAICGYATIAINFLGEELEQNSDGFDWLSRYAKGHGVTLHDVDTDSLNPRLAEMFILLVHAHFEDFMRSLIREHKTSQDWEKRGDQSLFEYLLKNLGLIHSSTGANERETIEYYRLARNCICHSEIKTTRPENQRIKLRKLLGINEDYMSPKPIGRFDYGDFFMFTRAVKAFAATICEAARPSDSEIAGLIAREIKPLNRFRNKPARFRNAVRQLLQMKYQLDYNESEGIVNCIMSVSL